MSDRIGDLYQQTTKYHRNRLPAGGPEWTSRPEAYKQYPSARRVPLPEVTIATGIGLEDIVRRRKSVRSYSGDSITIDQLSYLLWTSTGLRSAGGRFRTAPSAGALYPIETYLTVNRVDGVPPGVYHYNIQDHALEELKPGEFGEATARAALDQGMCAECAVVFIWTAVFGRTKFKYGERGYRYIYLDAGHIGAHLSLAATSLGLGSCQIAALYDDEVNALVGADGTDEGIVYMSAVGVPP